MGWEVLGLGGFEDALGTLWEARAPGQPNTAWALLGVFWAVSRFFWGCLGTVLGSLGAVSSSFGTLLGLS